MTTQPVINMTYSSRLIIKLNLITT